MNEVYEFLKKCGTYYLATVEGDQPRVRPFGFYMLFKDKLYFGMGKQKQSFAQTVANPNIEVCAMNAKRQWIRIRGTAVVDDSPETAVLVGLITPNQNERKTAEYLDELEFLLETAGGVAVGRFVQPLDRPNSVTYLGTGKLEELKQQRPDLPVDAMIGRIYYMSNDFDAALRAYDKGDKEKMEDRDLSDYAMTAFFKQKYDKSFEIAKFGLRKKPRHAAFNRLAFFNGTELKKFDEALAYADALFHKSDSAKFSYYDYTYYGNALSGAKQFDKAIEMYNKALQQDDMDNKAKRAGVIKQLSEAYKAQEDYPNAIKNYQEYLNTVEKASANDIAGLAQLHLQNANKKQTKEEQTECFMLADKTYQDLEAKFQDAVEYSTFMRARVNSYMDPDQKKGLAKPFYEKLDQLVGDKENKDAADKARLTEAYRYLISYYFVIMDNKDTAKEYAQKLIVLDPNNEIAKQVLGIK